MLNNDDASIMLNGETQLQIAAERQALSCEQ